MKRFSGKQALVLTLAAGLLTASAGCSGGGKGSVSSVGSTGYEVVDAYTNDDVADMKGYEFTIASPFIYDDVSGHTLTNAEIQFEKRRREVEKEFNCTIKLVNQQTDMASIASTILAGDKLADLVQFSLSDLYQAIGSGYVRPLNTIKGIDVNDSRWLQGYMRLGYYNSAPYGLYFWRPMEVRGMVLFNKTLLKQYGITEDMYQLVRDGKWTFDKFRELAVAATKDTNGDGQPDTYGVITSTPEKLGTDFIAANGGALARQENGQAIETFNDANAVTAMNYLYDLVNVDKVFYVPDQWTSKSTYYAGGLTSKDIYTMFTNNRAAFAISESWIANQIVKPMATNTQYGALPMPKGPDAADYVSPANYALLFAVTNNNKDIDKVVPIINALGKPASGYEGEEWQDAAIEMDFFQDGDSGSVDMYKLCYEKSSFDFGLSVKSNYTSFSEIGVMMPIFWKQGTPASQLEAFTGMAKKTLDNLFAGK